MKLPYNIGRLQRVNSAIDLWAYQAPKFFGHLSGPSSVAIHRRSGKTLMTMQQVQAMVDALKGMNGTP